MVLLQGFGDEEETPRQYLEHSELMKVLQEGLDETLKNCSQKENGGEAMFTQDPLIFLASWLKRNNPTFNEEMRRKLDEAKLAESAGTSNEEKDELIEQMEATVAGN
mmetsp:Transcript_12848/g.32873  ORF Transcript_12848/g.32873 Transcript_12848/m.32873 type:complete len:107 (-) Transcript_12848:331-651(-)|eukprot:CAMPEP_0115862674 /NCGR_PEP_ID=MMETSP0287-20121206/18299_1 /TAXON_ID=412157 /ORGANISM="Chrysochromulina rotalis, Strain UIO044" /LENGTH=106 /DNA_ID=CAMNT_0003317105 /DNA_START=19 /DNA_END=339 /DNA_ORIENTATION=+